ncbi:uncharacterized protein [Clytia hemisphaerica]|uniref:ZP domain-containing protein n=1 Tax=Clytia hemisphaerica TaxID=252671 RepID=A0A7M5WMZ7_9CNID
MLVENLKLFKMLVNSLIILLVIFCKSNTDALPTDIDCNQCSSEECSLDLTIPCCKLCLAHIKCTPTEMMVTIPRAAANFALEDLSLADGKCGGYISGENYIFNSGMSDCGTKSVFIRQSHILYKNEVRHKNGKPLYSLTCLFKRRLPPVRKGIRVRANENQAPRMYHTTVFGRRKNDNTIYLEDNEHFFFEIKGPSYLKRRNMEMAVKSCYLDITEGSNKPGANPRRDVLINNGCARQGVETLMKTRYTLWFSVFMNDVPQQYNNTAVLNCDVILCYNSYNRRCRFNC